MISAIARPPALGGRFSLFFRQKNPPAPPGDAVYLERNYPAAFFAKALLERRMISRVEHMIQPMG